MKSILFFCILCITIYAHGQSTFQQILEKPEVAITLLPEIIIENQIGYIYALSTVDGGKRDIKLVKLNDIGTIQWDTIYDFTPSHEFTPRMVIAHDGGVVVASTSYSYPISDQDGIKDILVWKINELGEIVWQKVIAARSFHSIIATSDGNYILLGNHYSESLDLLITKINEDGDVLWQKIIERPLEEGWKSFEVPTQLKEIDGFVYVGADIIKTLNPVWSDGLLYQFDLNGNINWEIRIPSVSKYDIRKIKHIFKFDNTLFLIADYREILQTFTFTEQGSFKNISDSIIIDLDGLVLDNSCGYKDALIGIKQITEYEFVFKKYDRLDSAAYYEVNFDAPLGGFRDIIKSKDGGYITLSMTGWSDSLIISKTDCFGNWKYWDEDCNPTILPNSVNIRLSPNPVASILLIEAPFDFYTINITNLAGQVITYANECKCNRQAINLDHLAAGFYQVQINGDEGSAFGNFVKL